MTPLFVEPPQPLPSSASSSASAVPAVPLHSEVVPILGQPQGERQAHMEALVLRVVRELTGDGGEVTASTPLMEAGVDSLAATELVNRLRADTGLALSPTLVFEQPTPRAIAAHVLELLRNEERRAYAVHVPPYVPCMCCVHAEHTPW